MGTDVAEVVETLPCPKSFKVHRAMCVELMKLVDKIAKIFPEIEAARPRCASGIQALCLLNSAIEKAKLLLQYCSESSKLYLALTGDVIVSRYQRSRNLLEQSLSQIQNMVPVMLAVEISRIIDDLRAATFILDSSEEEAGKAVRELLQQGSSSSDSLERSEIEALQRVTFKLHITSPKAILIEKRSIKKLLDKVGDNDHTKKNILKYLLYLLKRYGHLITRDEIDNAYAQDEGSFAVSSQPSEVESCRGFTKYEAQPEILSSAIPPEEFKCPLSLRLMYDPVIIQSGQTFERMWIQKWFDDGNDTCPKTGSKLIHQSLTPNAVMKDLISKWCTAYGISIPDPSVRSAALPPWDLSSNSISSFGNSMNDLRLPVDVSNISLGSLDASYGSDASRNKIVDGFMSMQPDDDVQRLKASRNVNETDLAGLAELQWECQCKVVEDAERLLKHDNQSCHSVSSMNFVEPLIRFLRDARDKNDMKAKRVGSQLLLALVSKNRIRIPCLHEDAFSLLASFLDLEVNEEAFAILEVLSSNPFCRSKIVASGILPSIVKILESPSRKYKEYAIKILHNLLLDDEIYSHIVPSEYIPKLVPFLNDTALARHCLVVMKNLCDIEDGRVSIAETSGCLASLAELLEIGSQEDQEQAAAILLSLCSQRIQYCHLVMDEGIIPSLVNISINGNDKGKVMALELLRLLRDIPYCDEQEYAGSDIDTSRDASSYKKDKKTSGFFGKKFSIFSKTAHSRTKNGVKLES